MTPLLLVALGGLFAELSGLLNIALEGLMLCGSFFAVLFAAYTQSLLLGALLGALSAMALSALLAFVILRLRANPFIAGLAVNLFAAGFTVSLAYRIFGTKGVVTFSALPRLSTLYLSWLDRIPIVREIANNHSYFVYLSWLMVALSSWVLYRSSFGLRLRASGLHEQAVISLGIRVERYRFSALLISGFMAGLGGAFLTLNLRAFVPNISAGKGWIALVVIFLGQKRPRGVLLAAFVIALAEAFSNYAQGALRVPAELILALPYLFSLVALVLFSIYEKRNR